MEAPSRPSAGGPRHTNNDGSAASASGHDVGLVVARAKKAAASLWMLIHAENCTKAADQCPHRVSCGETQRLLAHVRSCASSPGFGCPDGVRGCDDAKKLLAHYRRCREIRARRAVGKHLDRQGVVRKEHNCLVCTFLARHATTMLDKALAITSDNITPNNSNSSQLANTLYEASRHRSDSCPEKSTTCAKLSSSVDNSIKSTGTPSSRQRSASCSILPTKSSSHLICGGCDTITEEEDNESSGVAEVR